MIQWEVTDEGLRVTDRDNATVHVDAADVAVCDDHADVPRPVDETVGVRATELRFPMAIVYVASLSDDEQWELDPNGGALSLPADEYVVDIDAEIKLYLRVDGPCRLRVTPSYDAVILSFPGERPVTVGVRSRHQAPDGTVTVPATPAGLATYLTHAHAAHKTTSPDRSFPTLRGHPPLVEVGESVDIPDHVAAETPTTAVELVAPPDLATLFVLAPLAYYLQATVRVEPRETPVLRARETDPAPSTLGREPAGIDLERPLSAMPALQDDVTALLRKVFFMDSLVRNAGPHGTDLAELGILDALELDAARLYEESSAARLATYLDVPDGAIEHRLPDWHLSTYVEPTPSHVDCLPYLLDDMSLVYLPQTSELDGSELVERSLDDFYRGAGDVASVDVVKPELRASRVHGWLADGVPIDVFKATPQAYRNRLDYLDRDGETTNVTVVLNDDDMHAEHADVEEIYRARAEDIQMSVSVREHLSCAELARVFESETHFVHYIGHCESDGLRCPDGRLAATSLSDCNAETFFLNACGSYHEGVELVRRGSVAGAVTFSKVLNEQAMRVGSAFARLLVHGFGMERALRLARRRIMMGKDYAVVGDGTHTLTQSTKRLAASATLERLDDDRFFLTYDQFSTHDTGGFYRPYVPGNEYAYLCGNESEFALSREETVSFLRRAEMPVVYDGDVTWSDELCAALLGA